MSESASSAVQWKRPVPSDCCFHAARRDGGDEASRVPRISETNREDSAAAVAVRSAPSPPHFAIQSRRCFRICGGGNEEGSETQKKIFCHRQSRDHSVSYLVERMR